MDIAGKLKALRMKMIEMGIDALIIPTGDPHQNEYLPEFYKTRQWISGFTGSAGTVVVTQDHAGLWTDGRYFLQADMQLAGTEFVLHKLIVQGAAEYADWLAVNLVKGSVISVDGNTLAIGASDILQEKLEATGQKYKITTDLFAGIWPDRPPLSVEQIFEHDVAYAGMARAQKIESIRQKMAEKNANYLLITALDDIAWLLNLRGRDIECNPVFNAYVLISPEKTILFIDQQKISPSLKDLLSADNIGIETYESINNFLTKISPDDTIQVSPASLSTALFSAIKTPNIIRADSPVMHAKAQKNFVEQSHIRTAMAKDGAALVSFFQWLEVALKGGDTPTEYDLAQKLIEFRSQQPGYYGESFDAIIGYRANGAIIHYKPEKLTSATIKPEGLLLVDSGGQYVDGTTDITRTIALGQPNDFERKCFTLVLKGNIAVSKAVFLAGTRGIQLDILARQFLWEHHLTYGHGTGHGVGFFLNVHEPPQGIVNGLGERGVTPITIGSLTSNEPGYYKEGAFGIRIENLLICQPSDADGNYLQFETVTLFPIDKTLIDASLMSKEEIAWLNQYHAKVLESISPYLNASGKSWLTDKCSPI